MKDGFHDIVSEISHVPVLCCYDLHFSLVGGGWVRLVGDGMVTIDEKRSSLAA